MALVPDKLKNLILLIGSHRKVSQLGLTKLYKLIYLSDVLALRELGQSITGSDYIKYEHGPVPSRGEKAIKKLKAEGAIVSQIVELDSSMKMNRITSRKAADRRLFSAGEQDVIERVCATYGNWTATALSNLSHKEPAWAAAATLDKMSHSLMHYGIEEDSEGL